MLQDFGQMDCVWGREFISHLCTEHLRNRSLFIFPFTAQGPGENASSKCTVSFFFIFHGNPHHLENRFLFVCIVFKEKYSTLELI